jgi:glycosyltransferase involved in cell wall biosynthesis
MKRVLVVAYLFPPAAGAGVQRTLKFVKYLPGEGWDPVVLTTASTMYPVRDTGLLAEIPDRAAIVRAWDPPPLRWLARGLDGVGLTGLRDVAGWPDDALAWLPGALFAGIRAARRHDVDAIFTTAAPFTAHLLGGALHRLTGLPWIADFRDEWADNPYMAGSPRALRALSRHLENRVCTTADRVTVAADYFQLEGATRGEPHRLTITNGVDEDDLPRRPARPPADRMRLSFVGTLYGARDAAPVLKALAELADSGEIDRDRLEVRIVGNVWLPPGTLTGAVTITQSGYVDHAQALDEMARASALLFYEPADSLAPTGKIFEYLASGRPILCVARRDNLAFRLVDGWSAGACAEPGSAGGIREAVLSLYSRWEAGELEISPGVRERVLREFSRRRLAARLATALDHAVGAGER